MKLRAGFMGSPDFAVPSLRVVSQRCDLRVVVCQPDRPAGRGRKLTAPAVKEAATRLGVPIEQPAKMKDGTLLRALAAHDLDIIVVVAFGRILPPELLALPRHGCINVHGSILPQWRGAAPIQRSVLAGDRETGVSIMAMDAGLDTGPVYRIRRTPMDPLETSGALFGRLSEIGADALDEFLAAYPEVEPPQPQDHRHATLAPPLHKDEGWTAWERPYGRVIDHIRGMDPWPVAMARRGEDVLKLFVASPSSRCSPALPPGTIVAVDELGMHVQAHEGLVCVAEVQPPGRRRMAAAAYFAGKPLRSEEERLG